MPKPDTVAMLEALECDGVNLTPWEEQFVEDFRDREDQERPHSERQIEILESIYAKRTP